MFYSPSTNGFYNTNQYGPEDMREVDDETYLSLLAAQRAGQVIQADQNGNPEIVNYVPPSIDPKPAYQASARSALNATDMTVIRVNEAILKSKTTANAADVQALLAYRDALRVIANPSWNGDTTQPLPTRPPNPVGT